MESECPFCGNARNEGRVLKDGTYSYVIFSNPRVMPGHLLVIPKRHVDGRVNALTKEECDEIFDFLSEFQTKILDKVSSGCDIRQNYKPYVKNSRTHVNHMHWHLWPREFKDDVYEKSEIYRNDLYQKLTAEERERMFKILS